MMDQALQPRICNTCIHYRKGNPAVCYHPQAILGVDIVEGEAFRLSCKEMRQLACGIEARFFT